MKVITESLTQKRMRSVFDRLVEAAVKGERCPDNTAFGVGCSEIVPALAHMGAIEIEISGRNYRRVVIKEGPHAGKGTAPDPSGHHVWKVIKARTKAA